MLNTLEITQQTYMSAAVLVRVAGEEHARARAELLAARAGDDAERLAIAAFRSAYATKLWEMRLREEHEALGRYNIALLEEARRSQVDADRIGRRENGAHRCSKLVVIPEGQPFWPNQF